MADAEPSNAAFAEDALTAEEEAAVISRRNRLAARRTWLTRLVVAVVVIGVLWALWYFLIGRNHVSTDNAYVNAEAAQVTPLIAGAVIELNVRDTQAVKQGDVLARLDPEESGDDRGLIAVESTTGLSRNRIAGAMTKAGLPAFTSVLDQVVGGVHHYLVEVPGMIADGDGRLRELEAGLGLESGRVVSIGAYAVPATPRT